MAWNRGATRRSSAYFGSTGFRLLVAVGLAAGGLTAVAPQARATSTATWSIAPSPSPFAAPFTPLSGVSCTSATNCVAVGIRMDFDRFTSYVTVSEHWDGTTWSQVTTPLPTGAVLSAVSCSSATHCLATGYLQDLSPLVERWDGISWSIVASPTPPTGALRVELSGVTCASATSCYAVGSTISTAPAYRYGALIEHWDGAAWKVVARPNPSGAVTSALRSVSCFSADNCMAVGFHVETGDNKGGPLAVRWNGKSSAITPIAVPKTRPIDALLAVASLSSVSCPTATACIAVGNTSSDALVERWNGTKWSRVATPALTDQYLLTELRGVSCISPTDCFAVGDTFHPYDQREGVAMRNSVIEHWNGTAWKILPRAAGVPVTKNSRGAAGLSELNAVSCTTASSCVAIGNSSVAERWNGTKWSLAPLSGSKSYSQLNQVACASTTMCFAVGQAVALLAGGQNTLIERWTGTSWAAMPSPTPAGINVYAELDSIACVGPADCTAVGSYYAFKDSGLSSQYGVALIEHWNGRSWTIVAKPALPKTTNYSALSAVSCFSATDCNAVGYYSTYSEAHGGATYLLAEHWNGARWAIVPIPGPVVARFYAMACTSPTSCFTVGAANYKTQLIERWNGAKWSIVTSPKPKAGTSSGLAGLSCVSTVDCTAVGSSSSAAQNSTKTLVEHWNGTRWTVASAPSPGGPYGSSLSAVSCSGPSSCTAVGSVSTGPVSQINFQPLIEEWDGTSWNVVPSPAADTPTSRLAGVACGTPTSCVAVGSKSSTNGLFTFAEQTT
jgi:hypothetical protein